MENQPNPEVSGSDAKITALEARLETLEKSLKRVERWQSCVDKGEQFLQADILVANGVMLNHEGKRRVYLMATENGAELCLYDGDEQMRVNITVDSSDEDAASVQILGGEMSELTPEMSANMENSEGKVLAFMRSSEEGGHLQLLPNTWGELKESGQNPVVGVRLDANPKVAPARWVGQLFRCIVGAKQKRDAFDG